MKLTCSIDEIKRLRPEEVKEIRDNDKSGEFQLLDVRQPYEYEAGHIPGAKWVPLGELEYRHAELERDKKIITYCRSGHRSMAANTLLCGLGFENVYNLDGGILNWHYDVIKGIAEERPELITGNEDVCDILMLALKLEKGALDFYSKAQEKVRDKKAVQTFQKLAGWEEKHIEKIYVLYSKLMGEPKLPPLERLKAELSSTYMEGGMKINEELIKIGERVGFVDDFEALEIALEKEYMSYDFYKRVAGLVGDSEARNMLHELAGEERKHINALLQQIEEPEGGRQE
ncbi:Thiosulfate sulfurtransferase GlpE [ANME-1 cluster archaeon GoMg3.2]|nr:Thiosulfate sulfurtransferase GlpE [ANME-1 cluster archaeon GoMg3.2]